MNLLRPSPGPEKEEGVQTVFESLPEEGFGMEWDILYDEEIRMSERNDQNPYIFIPHSEAEGSGEDVEGGSGDNEGYSGDLQYDDSSEDTLDYSGDGFTLEEEGSTNVELGQRRMDYSDYESPNDVQDLSALIDEEGTVD